jgi:hypothetical protein
MIHRSLAPALLVLAPPIMADDVKPAPFPDRPAPEFATVADFNRTTGEIKLRYVVTLPVEIVEKVVRDGKEVDKVTVRYNVAAWHKKVLLREATFYSTRGEKLAAEAVLKRVHKGTTLLVAQDGKQVHPAYLQVIQDDTLVLVSKDLVERSWIRDLSPVRGLPGSKPRPLPK